MASYEPCVSADGQFMVFSARPAGPGYWGSLELYMLQRGADTPVQLTDFGGDEIEDWVFTTDPSISFDGSRVAFQTGLWDGNNEIGYLYLDDSQTFPLGPDDVFRVTDNPAEDLQPAWSPDGKWIAFVTDRDGNYELYKIFDPITLPPWPDPSIVRLTYTDEDESNPDWSNYY
jgi:Tol biopolymer transport system component